MRTEESPKNMRGLRLVGKAERASALSNYGPVRAGLTTTQVINREAALLELLSSLEKRVEILESKYLEALDTFQSVTQRLAVLSLTTINEITTDTVK
jgi:hypothetical protein